MRLTTVFRRPIPSIVRHSTPQLRDLAGTALKGVIAATASWLIAGHVLHAHLPVLAPIAALLTVQGTVYATVRQGLRVVAGVLVGAAIGLVIGSAAGGHWWSVAAVTTAGILAGALPPLHGGSGPSTQVPVTALLVIALGEGYGFTRLLDTAVGGAMGILVTATVLPPVRTPQGAAALGGLAEEMAAILRDAADGTRGAWQRDAALDWLDRARSLEQQVMHARSRLADAEQSLRWNPRRTDRRSVELLSPAATALDHVAGQVRAVTRALADRASDDERRAVPPPALPEDYPDVLECCADAVVEFRGLVTGQLTSDRRLRDLVAHGRGLIDGCSAAVASDTVSSHGSRQLAVLLEEPWRLLGEVSPDGAHGESVAR